MYIRSKYPLIRALCTSCVADLRQLSPPDAAQPPVAKPAAVVAPSNHTPQDFHDTSGGSDTSSFTDGRLPDDIRDLPPSVLRHLDELIAKDGELLNHQMSAIDAMILGTLRKRGASLNVSQDVVDSTE